MRICVACKDLLLEKALELFLKEHLVAKKDCDFIVCDEKGSHTKPLFIIAQNSPFLEAPFSKERLLEALEEFDEGLKAVARKLAQEQKKLLEEKIDAIANEFKKEYDQRLNKAILSLKDRLIKALIDEQNS